MVRGSGYGDVVAVAPIMATGVGNGCWQRLLATIVGASGSGIVGEATGTVVGSLRVE